MKIQQRDESSEWTIAKTDVLSWHWVRLLSTFGRWRSLSLERSALKNWTTYFTRITCRSRGFWMSRSNSGYFRNWKMLFSSGDSDVSKIRVQHACQEENNLSIGDFCCSSGPLNENKKTWKTEKNTCILPKSWKDCWVWKWRWLFQFQLDHLELFTKAWKIYWRKWNLETI